MLYILTSQSTMTMGSRLFESQGLVQKHPFTRINTDRKIKVSREHVS